ANASLGSSVGGLTFDGGTLNTTGTFSASRAIIISSAGTINTDESTTLTLSGAISGAGNLVKSGLGSLVLSGANSYSGGTTLSSGLLQIGADSALGDAAASLSVTTGTVKTTATFSSSRAVAISSSATFDTNSGTAVTLSGDISG